MNDPHSWLPSVLALILLASVATAGLLAARIPAPLQAFTAIARAAVQLALLSIVLAGVITDLRWVALALAVMLSFAVMTAARRARTSLASIPRLAYAIVSGPLAVLVIVFATGALEFSPRYLLAVGGIVTGGAMTIAILTERLLRVAVTDHWDQVEGWLALGASPRQSVAPYAREAVRTALMPAIDQTRTTGIVVMPGAFVGAVFAGASPLEAGRFQLIVLAGILAAGVITAILIAFTGPAIATRPTRPDAA